MTKKAKNTSFVKRGSKESKRKKGLGLHYKQEVNNVKKTSTKKAKKAEENFVNVIDEMFEYDGEWAYKFLPSDSYGEQMYIHCLSSIDENGDVGMLYMCNLLTDQHDGKRRMVAINGSRDFQSAQAICIGYYMQQPLSA